MLGELRSNGNLTNTKCLPNHANLRDSEQRPESRVRMFSKRTNWNLEPNRLSAALAVVRASGKQILDLTISNPTCGFHYDSHAIREALSNPAVMHYEPNLRGIESARKAVADYYFAHSARVDLESIFLTVSTSEAYSFALRLLCNPHDEVLVPSPSYPLLDFLADILDVSLVSYPLLYDHGWQIDFHALDKSITERTRAIIIVNPNNPTGHYLKASEIERLNEICERNELALLGDEVFLDFPLSSAKASTLAANKGALTFTLSGISKISGLPQMKMAWLAVSGPERIKAQTLARLEIIADTYLSVNAPVQLALPNFLKQSFAFQEELLLRVNRNLGELDRQLAQQTLCSRHEIEGGWYAIVRVPDVQDDDELALGLLEDENIYVHPGYFYGFSDRGRLVISLIAPERDFSEGVRLLLNRVNRS